jgi:hypothetical protein
MGKNAVYEYVQPVSYDGTADEMLVLLQKVIAIMNRGFENMDTRLQLVEEKLGVVDRLLKQMGTDKRI